MDSNLTVNASIGVRDGCGMKYLTNADGMIEFSFGGERPTITVVFDVPALRHFAELAGDALEKVAVAIVRGEHQDADEDEDEADS
jgi:hypothetical protein